MHFSIYVVELQIIYLLNLQYNMSLLCGTLVIAMCLVNN